MSGRGLPKDAASVPPGYWDGYRTKKDRHWRYRHPSDGHLELMVKLPKEDIERFSDDEALTPIGGIGDYLGHLDDAELAAIESYARHFDDVCRASPLGGRRQETSDAECVRAYLATFLRDGKKRLRKVAELRGEAATRTRRLVARAKLLITEAKRSGRIAERGTI